MGMFDYIHCKYPLPIEDANSFEYQTKDTPSQFLDEYEIREDGTLWHQNYTIEDKSEAAKWLQLNPGKELPEELKGLPGFIGSLSRTNFRWEQITDFIGEIRFYSSMQSPSGNKWIEWSAYFEEGKLVRLNLVENKFKNNRE